jgi:hypothetical protein
MKWKENSRCAVADTARRHSGFKFDDEQSLARLFQQTARVLYFHAA